MSMELVKHIQNIFQERCRSNEQYSLRAFARSLGIPVSSLSEIMNGKRALSPKLALKLGKALNMSKEQIEAFTGQKTSEADYSMIALDSFYLISEGHHYAILQLMRSKTFRRDPKWIARRLKIEAQQVEQAIERLIRVGIIEVQADGTLKDITGGHTTHLKSNFTNEQLRAFQIKALEKAIQSLKNDPIEVRDNTSMTMAISKAAIPFAKEEIKKFRRELTTKLEQFGEPDEVYQLAISLNPLSDVNNTTGANYEIH